MMGIAVLRRGLGQAITPAKVIGSGIGVTSTALTAIEIGAGPIGWAVAGISMAAQILPLVMGIINGCGQTCINDTEVTEGVQMAYNALWYDLTGEDLGGVTGAGGCTCTPGQCGKEKCAIFDPQGTAYPNVPSGPLGLISAQDCMTQATSVYQAGRAKLLRSPSLTDYDFNYNGAMNKFEMVAKAQAAAAAAPAASSSSLLTQAESLLSNPSSLFQSPTALLVAAAVILAIAVF